MSVPPGSPPPVTLFFTCWQGLTRTVFRFPPWLTLLGLGSACSVLPLLPRLSLSRSASVARMTHQGSRSLLKIGSWTLSNLCDGQPRPVLDVHTVIPALSKLLQHTDSEILRSLEPRGVAPALVVLGIPVAWVEHVSRVRICVDQGFASTGFGFVRASTGAAAS